MFDGLRKSRSRLSGSSALVSLSPNEQSLDERTKEEIQRKERHKTQKDERENLDFRQERESRESPHISDLSLSFPGLGTSSSDSSLLLNPSFS